MKKDYQTAAARAAMSEIVMPDVLFVDRKIKEIAELMRTRPVTAG